MKHIKLWYGVLSFALVACGGADKGARSVGSAGGGSPSGGQAISSAGACGPTAGAKVINENPKIEVPGTAFTANLSALGMSVTLTDLDGSCFLKNSTFEVTVDREFPTQIANVGQGLIFTPTNPQFQQVSTYYHANKVRNIVLNSGADLSALTNLSFDAHCKDFIINGVDAAANNAFYLPVSKQICLGYTTVGGKKIYASDDADVIGHEFGHGVNNTLSTTNILYSSTEAGAIDEGTADYWALTANGNPSLSEWFLGAIDANDTIHADPYYQRIASQNRHYPEDMMGEIHFDARLWVETLWSLRSSTLGVAKTDALVTRTLNFLPSTTKFAEGVTAMQSAALSLGFSQTEKDAINTVLMNKGLLRTDATTGLQVSNNNPHKNIYIIDDHSYTYQVNGNCNGVLDVGETALVMVNLESSGSVLGLVYATISSNTGGITIPAGGGVAEYLRLNGGGADFVDVLSTSGVYADQSTIAASFLINATSAGQKDFTIMAYLMGGASLSIPVSITVQSNATMANSCSGGNKVLRSLWPVP